ncbi:hypothetical protein AVEN_266838-1, partial [Araneus ventricosus]
SKGTYKFPDTYTRKNLRFSVVNKSDSALSAQTNPFISTIYCSKPSDSATRSSLTIKNLPIPSSPSVFPVCDEASDLPDLTDFKIVTNKKKAGKDSPTKTNNTIAKAEKISKFYTTSPREVLNSIETQSLLFNLK